MKGLERGDCPSPVFSYTAPWCSYHGRVLEGLFGPQTKARYEAFLHEGIKLPQPFATARPLAA